MPTIKALDVNTLVLLLDLIPTNKVDLKIFLIPILDHSPFILMEIPSSLIMHRSDFLISYINLDFPLIINTEESSMSTSPQLLLSALQLSVPQGVVSTVAMYSSGSP